MTNLAHETRESDFSELMGITDTPRLIEDLSSLVTGKIEDLEANGVIMTAKYRDRLVTQFVLEQLFGNQTEEINGDSN